MRSLFSLGIVVSMVPLIAYGAYDLYDPNMEIIKKIGLNGLATIFVLGLTVLAIKGEKQEKLK